MKGKLRLMAVAAATAILALAGCGGDDDEQETAAGETSTEAAADEGDVDRFCQLAAQLDRAGNRVFRELEQQGDATQQDFQEAERQFLEENEDQINEIVSVAPAEIADDAQTFAEGLRARAGLGGEEADPEAVRSADENLSRFEQQNCER